MENLATLIYNKTGLERISAVRNCLILKENEIKRDGCKVISRRKKTAFRRSFEAAN